MKKNEQQIRIQSFGYFDIYINGESVIQSFKNSKKTITLFKYFVAFIGEKLTAHRIMEANFGEYMYSDPSNTLRGHIHRLRGVLADFNQMLGYKAFSLDYVADYYVFSIAGEPSIDFLEFQERVKSEDFSDKENLKEIKAIYRGDFMDDTESIGWSRMIRQDYRKRFLRYMTRVIYDLCEKGEYLEALAEADSVQDRLFFEEDFQEAYIKTLVALEKKQEVLDYYDFLKTRYQVEKVLSPPERITTMVKRLDEMMEEVKSMDFFSIEKKLRQAEEISGDGVFFCSKEFFLDLYRLEARRKKRDPNRITSVGIVHFDAADYRDMSKEEMKEIQEKIAALISKTIREQDVLTILSDTQIAFMLFEAQPGTVVDVDERMKDEMNRIKSEHMLVIKISYKTITAGNEYSKELML